MPASRYSYLDQESDEVATNLTYELFIQVVTVISLLIMTGIYLLPLPTQVVEVLQTVDYLVAIIFVLDFIRSLKLSHNRLRYFIRGGWVDLLGSLPAFPLLRVLRIFRMIRSWRKMRQNTPQEILVHSRAKLAESTLFIVFLTILVVITLGSSMVVMAESASPEANILTGYEAVWWAFVTMATVGYGDYTPVTESGRIIAVFVMLTGVGFFGVLSSFLASTFIANRRKGDEDEMAVIKTELAAIRGLLEGQPDTAANSDSTSQPEES